MSSAADLAQAKLAPAADVLSSPASADRWLTELHALLRELEAVTTASHTLPPVFSEAVDDHLVQTRLGVAAGLFAALQCKNAATAGHALRVALSCSAWATKLGLPESERDAIEIAALLLDIGVISAPDHILLKPGALDSNEAAVMTRSRKMGLEILRRSCNSPQTLEIAEHVPAWYDGSRNDSLRCGLDIPRGARMIAIVEAFDAMTTDHVYRPARSRERAMAELFECAGTQFDPELVGQFADFQQTDPTANRREVADRWLRSLDPASAGSCWELNAETPPEPLPAADALFEGRLLDNMYDAVVFIDMAGRVVQWNRGAERLTGVAAVSVQGHAWHSELLGLSDEKGHSVSDADCPVYTATHCGVQSLRRLTIVGRGQRPVAVDTHAIPVINEQGITLGAILLFHDASSETSLEQRCQSLHEKATKDPMTQVANRAEFDRVHAMFVAAHQQQQVPCSLLMCDLDRFKLVNDTYGHQAGDDAIKSLASLLKSSCRPGDLVARYGGEEFVLLCADCDNASAARRAEQIRNALSQIAQPKLDGRAVTVSFGVTEIQPGDTPETMLRRADRALLAAKANGRNMVVQLGTGGNAENATSQPAARFFGPARPKELLEQDLVTSVPIKMAIEKLRGFVADHQAKIVAIDANRVQLEIDDRPTSGFRRLTDRPVSFRVDLCLEEEQLQTSRTENGQSAGGSTTRTRIKVTVSPRKDRDRRRRDVMVRAREVLMSFRSYLMASEHEPSLPTGAISRAKRILVPWLMQK
jgi:diguanylate cyclase (GGDEF)-like protein